MYNKLTDVQKARLLEAILATSTEALLNRYKAKLARSTAKTQHRAVVSSDINPVVFVRWYEERNEVFQKANVANIEGQMELLVNTMRADPSARHVGPFFNRFFFLLNAYAATKSYWTNRQQLAKIKRALAGQWDRQIERYLELEEADIDIDTIQDSLVAKANDSSSLPDPAPAAAFGADDQSASTPHRREHGKPAPRNAAPAEDCRNYSRGHCNRGSKCIYRHPQMRPSTRQREGPGNDRYPNRNGRDSGGRPRRGGRGGSRSDYRGDQSRSSRRWEDFTSPSGDRANFAFDDDVHYAFGLTGYDSDDAGSQTDVDDDSVERKISAGHDFLVHTRAGKGSFNTARRRTASARRATRVGLSQLGGTMGEPASTRGMIPPPTSATVLGRSSQDRLYSMSLPPLPTPVPRPSTLVSDSDYDNMPALQSSSEESYSDDGSVADPGVAGMPAGDKQPDDPASDSPPELMHSEDSDTSGDDSSQDEFSESASCSGLVSCSDTSSDDLSSRPGPRQAHIPAHPRVSVTAPTRAVRLHPTRMIRTRMFRDAKCFVCRVSGCNLALRSLPLRNNHEQSCSGQVFPSKKAFGPPPVATTSGSHATRSDVPACQPPPEDRSRPVDKEERSGIQLSRRFYQECHQNVFLDCLHELQQLSADLRKVAERTAACLRYLNSGFGPVVNELSRLDARYSLGGSPGQDTSRSISSSLVSAHLSYMMTSDDRLSRADQRGDTSIDDHAFQTSQHISDGKFGRNPSGRYGNFCLDSGATTCVVGEQSLLHDFVPDSASVRGVGGSTSSGGHGELRVWVITDSGLSIKLSFHRTLWISGGPNLISIPRLVDGGATFTVTHPDCASLTFGPTW